jgi:hypothetical protein
MHDDITQSQTVDSQPIIFPQLSNAISFPRSLPNDLLSAFNAAVFFASTADFVSRRLLESAPGLSPDSALSKALEGLAKLKEYRDRGKAAVHAVSAELTNARKGLPALGHDKGPNAHWLAMEATDRLFLDLCRAADPNTWPDTVTNPGTWLNARAIIENLLAVKQHLQRTPLLSLGSQKGFGYLLVQIQVEARRAAEARERNESSNRNSSPKTEPDKMESTRTQQADTVQQQVYKVARAMSVWGRLAQFDGDNIPSHSTGEALVHVLSQLLLELGTVLREDGWESRVNEIAADSDTKKYALTILQEAMASRAEELTRLLRDARQRFDIHFELEVYRWLRFGLMYEVLRIQPPIEPPPGWEGDYFTEINSVEGFVDWIDQEITVFTALVKIPPDREWDGKIIRNAYCLATHLGLTNIPEEPRGPFVFRDIVRVLQSLRRSCLSNPKITSGKHGARNTRVNTGGQSRSAKSARSAPKAKKRPGNRKQPAGPRVELRGLHEKPIVLGKEKEPLTHAQYNVVKALLVAGATGLTKDALIEKSGHSDALGILKRVSKIDRQWESVIHFAKIPGGHYSVR